MLPQQLLQEWLTAKGQTEGQPAPRDLVPYNWCDPDRTSGPSPLSHPKILDEITE